MNHLKFYCYRLFSNYTWLNIETFSVCPHAQYTAMFGVYTLLARVWLARVVVCQFCNCTSICCLVGSY